MDWERRLQLSTVIICTDWLAQYRDPVPDYTDLHVQADFDRFVVTMSNLRQEPQPKRGYAFDHTHYADLRSLLIEISMAKGLLQKIGVDGDLCISANEVTFLEDVYDRLFGDTSNGFAGIINSASRD